MKVLVTGGAGFIGSHTVELYQHKAEVVVLDNYRSGRIENLQDLNCRVVEGSLLDKKLLQELCKGVDYVFHLAALVSVAESMESCTETVEINVQGLLNVLEASREAKVKKLIFASSAAVYGPGSEELKNEALRPAPCSPYAITKLDGELYCQMYKNQGWLSTACVRFFNVFGPRQDPGSDYAAAVPNFVARALAGEPITIFGDGGQTRDFIYVKDVVKILSLLAEHTGAEGVYTAGYGTSITILELAQLVKRLLDSDSLITFEAERVGDLRHSTSNPSRLLKAGWMAKYTVKSGLEELITSLQK